MASRISVLLVVAFAVTVVKSRSAPTANARFLQETQETIIGPMQMSREKQTAYQPYPQRTMLLTGFYRPVRNSGDQENGLYASGTFLDKSPQPTQVDEVRPVLDKVKPVNNERRDKKKITVPVNEEDEYEDEVEDEEEDQKDVDDESDPAASFIPPKPDRGGRRQPSITQYFPVVFSIPRRGNRRSSVATDEELPGLIAAIANSYSTGKGGVASSVATAYGGSPAKKKRRITSNK